MVGSFVSLPSSLEQGSFSSGDACVIKILIANQTVHGNMVQPGELYQYIQRRFSLSAFVAAVYRRQTAQV